MNICNTPAEITARYANAGVAKTTQPLWRMFTVGIVAGLIIGLAAAATNTAAHSLGSVSAQRIACGLLFPFGLVMVILLGVELYTGNALLVLSVLDKKISVPDMLKNLLFVYLGNAVGGFLIALSCAWFGEFDYSDGALAVFTIKMAAAKCAITPGKAIVFGILCNLLVCAGALLAMCADDVTGKILGAYIPVTFFVICGFEHCVANMYYIPAGILAMKVPAYAAKAAQAGIDTTTLTWFNGVIHNLLPVTIGNFLGGGALGVFMWKCHPPKEKTKERSQSGSQAGSRS